MVLSGDGQLVWFEPLSDHRTATLRAFNLSGQRYQGRPVLAWFEGAVTDAHGQGHYLIVDDRYQQVARVNAGNGYVGDLHEFFITPSGTAVFTCYGTNTGDLSAFGGHKGDAYFYGVAQEVDIVTGKVLFEWRSDEHVPLAGSYAPVVRHSTVPWDYFHINSICIAPDGDFIISARNTWTVYKVSRQTGAVLWRMGGKHSDFSFGPGAHFAWQHHVNQHAGDIFTVFDNGAGDYVTESQSRGLVLEVDERAGKVTLQHQYLHPGGPVRAAALGSVQLLPNGHAFVGWGVGAAYSEYDDAGRPVAAGRLAGAGVESYRAFKASWTAQPTDPPAVAVESTNTQTTVYASWNGATEVRHWLVMAGTAPGKLAPVGTAPKEGFETAITVPHHLDHVAVEALDGRGRSLGRSLTVPA